MRRFIYANFYVEFPSLGHGPKYDMVGTKAGAQKAKERYGEDIHSRNGSKASTRRPFTAGSDRAREAGRKGGIKSKRSK